MKIIACLLFFAGPLADEFCVCDGCAGFVHREAVGVCATCKGDAPTIDDRLCGKCASKGPSCLHCGKRFRDPKLLISEVSVVDKQPRADLEYHVLKGEDGTSQGVYFDPRRMGPAKGRMMVLAASDAKGDLVARHRYSLGPKEKDFVAKGESDGPVSWRLWYVAGPPAPAKDGRFTLVLPAVAGEVFEIFSGDRLLFRQVFKDGTWQRVR